MTPSTLGTYLLWRPALAGDGALGVLGTRPLRLARLRRERVRALQAGLALALPVDIARGHPHPFSSSVLPKCRSPVQPRTSHPDSSTTACPESADASTSSNKQPPASVSRATRREARGISIYRRLVRRGHRSVPLDGRLPMAPPALSATPALSLRAATPARNGRRSGWFGVESPASRCARLALVQAAATNSGGGFPCLAACAFFLAFFLKPSCEWNSGCGGGQALQRRPTLWISADRSGSSAISANGRRAIAGSLPTGLCRIGARKESDFQRIGREETGMATVAACTQAPTCQAGDSQMARERVEGGKRNAGGGVTAWQRRAG